MIANGLDIVGYDFVKFHRSSTVRHEINGSDIHLYGTLSDEFSSLFSLVQSRPIEDSEYIDLRPGPVSKVGNLSIQSNTVDDVLLNVAIVSDSSTTAMVNGNSVVILVNQNDIRIIDLAKISQDVKLLKLAKDVTKNISNIRNYTIQKKVKIVDVYDDFTVRSIKNPFITNLNYTRYLNELNLQIKNRLPEYDLYIGRKDADKLNGNTIICTYSEIAKDRGKKMFNKLRRNMLHVLEITYEFRISEDYEYLRMFYEMTNYDFITNICEVFVKDNGKKKTWVGAVHWEVYNTNFDLTDVKNGNQNVYKSITARAQLHYTTSIDPDWATLVDYINMHYDRNLPRYEYKFLP